MADVVSGIVPVGVRLPAAPGFGAAQPDPGHSATYLTLHTSGGESGYALAFIPGRGGEIHRAATQVLAPMVIGRPVEEILADLGGFTSMLTGDGTLRRLGSHQGVVHLASAAIVNAAWDLYARREGKPVWRLLAEMPPQRLVDLIDFRHLRDALTPGDALKILQRAEPGRAQRRQYLLERGYPAYATTPGWPGHPEETLVHLAKQAAADGFGMIKLRVGADRGADLRRLRLAREAIGPGVHVAIDADQAWGVSEAISRIAALAPYDPYWIEEPTSPDDVLGHAAIRVAAGRVKVAAGRQVHNQVMVKQLLQAGAVDVLQVDTARVAGVTESVAILLLAAKYGVPVCQHASGAAPGEMAQHLAMFDYVAVSRTMEGRMIEHVDHSHEHFAEPVVIRNGRYTAPLGPGFGARLRPESLAG